MLGGWVETSSRVPFAESFGGAGSLSDCFPVSPDTTTYVLRANASWHALTGISAFELLSDSSWEIRKPEAQAAVL